MYEGLVLSLSVLGVLFLWGVVLLLGLILRQYAACRHWRRHIDSRQEQFFKEVTGDLRSVRREADRLNAEAIRQAKLINALNPGRTEG